jgi:hypothetical protein
LPIAVYTTTRPRTALTWFRRLVALDPGDLLRADPDAP